MPKLKIPNYSKLKNFVSDFDGGGFFSIDASVIFCKLRECKVNSDNEFNVTRRIKTDNHIETKKKRERNKILKKPAATRLQMFNKKSTFNIDLCIIALISVKIPLNKLSKEKIRQLFRKVY